MKEHGILMSAPMVRALLAGTKTQTRRIVKLPHENSLGKWEPTSIGGEHGGRLADGTTIPAQGAIWHTRTGDTIGFPHGEPGNRLWIREAWRTEVNTYDDLAPSDMDGTQKVIYEADGKWSDNHTVGRLRASMHMPRWASRTTLEITALRVERLQDISEADAIAEGVKLLHRPTSPSTMYGTETGDEWHLTARDAYCELWEQINGAGSWDANPWVWVVSFKRITL